MRIELAGLMRKQIKQPDVKSWQQILDEYADLSEPPEPEESEEE